MRTMLRAAALAAPLLIAAQPAQAQGFLKRLADRAVQRTEGQVERAIETGVTSTPEPHAPQTQAAAPAPKLAAAAAPKGNYTDNLPKPPEAETQRLAYNKFGEARCNDCEGGIDLDGRPRFAYDQFSGQYEERARRAGTWPVGHVHRWQGREASGSLTVLGEETVGGFPCKRLMYKLVRGKASAERPSLICRGLANSSSSVENWHEIY